MTLLYKIVREEVSGKNAIKKTKHPPESHVRTQRGHVHPFAWYVNPPKSGPKIGPQIAPQPHTPIAYARCLGRNSWLLGVYKED